MPLLAYIDTRLFLFLGGLPVFILLAILGCRLSGVKLRRTWISVIATLIFTGLFLLFLSGFGPFVNQKEIREYRMTWDIQPPPYGSMITQSEVTLTFVDFPTHSIYRYSEELADHLRNGGPKEVTVVFEVTSDYGKVRGYREREIAGLSGWQIDPAGAGSAVERGSGPSPWD